MDEERRGEAFEGDVKLTVIGKRLEPGAAAPDFTLDVLNPGDAFPHEVTLADGAGRVRLLHVVNSLDTPVCHVETRRWEELRGSLPAGARVYTVSMDLPFAQARWAKAAKAKNMTFLSDYKSADFGNNTGLLIQPLHLLARTVIVTDKDGIVRYMQVVPEITELPDMSAAMAAAKGLM